MRVMKKLINAVLIILLFIVLGFAGESTEDVRRMCVKKEENKPYTYKRYVCIETNNGDKLFYEEFVGKPHLNAWISMLSTNMHNPSKCDLKFVWDDDINKTKSFPGVNGDHFLITSIEIHKE